MIRIKQKIHFYREGHGRQRIDTTPREEPAPIKGRVPRVARLMALAIRFDQLLRDGEVVSQSELAHLTHVTQPRMTQILNLLHLAPDIQEAILFLPRTITGRDLAADGDVIEDNSGFAWSIWNSFQGHYFAPVRNPPVLGRRILPHPRISRLSQ